MKDIKGLEGKYAVSKNGRVWSYFSHKFLKAGVNHKGYFQVGMGKKGPTRTVHRLVAETFIKNPEHLPQVNHKNGKKLDNRVRNLEWCTNTENNEHATKNGLKAIKLSVEDAREVLRLKKCGLAQTLVGEMFGIDQSMVSYMWAGKAWERAL